MSMFNVGLIYEAKELQVAYSFYRISCMDINLSSSILSISWSMICRMLTFNQFNPFV